MSLSFDSYDAFIQYFIDKACYIYKECSLNDVGSFKSHFVNAEIGSINIDMIDNKSGIHVVVPLDLIYEKLGV